MNPDHCDCCETPMRHYRLGERSPSRLFVCQDCRDEGMKRLGRDVTALHVGFAADDKLPAPNVHFGDNH